MQNVAPTRRLGRRSRDLLVVAALVFLMGAFVATVGIALHIFNLVVPYNPGANVYDLTRKAILSLGIGIVFVSFLLALRSITWRTDNALARELGEQLAEQLDRQFVYIRNISKRPLGYLDAMLVSKHGVLVFRISPAQGRVFQRKGRLAAAKTRRRLETNALEPYATSGIKRRSPSRLPARISVGDGAGFRRDCLYARLPVGTINPVRSCCACCPRRPAHGTSQ